MGRRHSSTACAASLVIALTLAGCDGPSAPADGGALTYDAAQAEAAPIPPAEPSLPASPEAPRFTSCPEGWSALRGACEPWPDGRLPECEAGEAAFVGLGCRPIGSACPADGWPADLPVDRRVIHVRAGADLSVADGTRERPYPAIRNAISRAAEGDVVAVATGTYDEVLRIERSVTMRGACASQTILAPIGWAGAQPIRVDAPSVALRDLTVRAPSHPGGAVVVDEGGSLELADVHIDGAVSHGLVAWGAISGARVVIEDIAPDPTWHHASAITARDHGTIELRHVVVRGPMRAALEAFSGGAITVEAAAIHRVVPHPTAPWNVVVFAHGAGTLTLRASAVEQIASSIVTSRDASVMHLEDVIVRDAHEALIAQDDGRIEGERVLLERNRGAGILAFERGRIALSDVVARETHVPEGGWGGHGLRVSGEGTSVHLERARIESNVMQGVFAELGAQVTLVDAVVRGTRPRPGVNDGTGVSIREGARATLLRCEVADNRVDGIAVGGEHVETVVELTDVTVRDTQPARGAEGNGIFAGGQGRIIGERVLIERVSDNGIKLWNGGAATLEDLVILGARPDEPEMGGNGVWVTEGSSLALTRARIERSRAVGISLDGRRRDDASIASTAVLRDVVIRETESDALLGLLGNAVRLANGASAEVERGLFEDNREAAVAVQNPGSRADLTDVVIRATRTRGCHEREEDPCSATLAGGCGVTVFNEGAVALTRFVVRESALCGVMIAEGGLLELHEGEVAANPIGANVQMIDYDLALLTDRVRYVDNERNYDGARLPVPNDSLPTLP